MKDTKDMSVREIINLIIGDEFMNEPECRDALLDILRQFEKLEKENKILTIKNQSSLANNLCPDHRDKQADKCCLVCRIEELEKELKSYKDNYDR